MATVVTLAAGIITLPAPETSGSEEDSRGRYLVVLKNSAGSPADVAADHERRYGADVTNVYRYALKGYAARLPGEAVAAVARDPRVALVEQDQVVTGAAQQVPTGIRRSFASSNPSVDIDGSDDVRVDVDVAVMDTGIDTNHPDLDVVSSTDCTAGGSLGACIAGSGVDDNGHGTHVAGTVGALDNDIGVVGVAPGARLHGVKVLSSVGSGLLSWTVAGVDWVTARADTIEVANLSLECTCASSALDRAITASVDRGVAYVVAAGNRGRDAKDTTPANHPDVITVSALADFDGLSGGTGGTTCRSDVDDTLASFSNWGPHIEVAAPGVCILSTSNLGGYQVLSGTSMAAPHVAGATAILTSGANDPVNRAEVEGVRATIVGSGNLDWFDDSGDGIQEALLDVGDPQIFVANSPTWTLGSDPGNQNPVAAFTHSCSEFDCHFDAEGSSDPDGTISSYAWDFGDGTTGVGPTFDKGYAASGTYTVVLTVTDDEGGAAAAAEDVTVGSGGGGPGGGGSNGGTFTLRTTGARFGSSATVYLEWYGTDRTGMVQIYRDGEVIATTEDDGSHTDRFEGSSGSHTYKVCEEDSGNCSNESSQF